MLYIRKRALAALASAAWSGPAGGAENLGYMSLQHYNWVLFLARLGSAGGSVGAVAAADAADAADAAAAAVVATCAHLTELGEQLAAHMAKFGVLAIMCATILAAISFSTY